MILGVGTATRVDNSTITPVEVKCRYTCTAQVKASDARPSPGKDGIPKPLDSLVVLTWRIPKLPAVIVETATLRQDSFAETLRIFQGALQAQGLAYIASCQRIIWALQPALADAGPKLQNAYLALGRDLPEPETYHGFAAFRHLAMVAASMEALVPGEPQILGQVRSAVKACSDAGVLGPDLRHVFDLVLRTAKSVRTKTRFFEGKVSILPLASDVLAQSIRTRQKPRAVLLGTGEMAAKAARMIQRMAPTCRLHVVSRDWGRAVAAATDWGATAHSLGDFIRDPPAMDVAVLAMDTDKPLLSAAWLKAQASRQPLTILDLAIPRNAERPPIPVRDLKIVQLDELAAISEAGKARRGAAYEDALRVLDGELDRIEQEYNERCHASTMSQLTQRFRSVAEQRWRDAPPYLDLENTPARKWYEQTVRALLHEASKAVKGGGRLR
jgi:glutamyl-tRNA reductase